jgi:hypothetical protein
LILGTDESDLCAPDSVDRERVRSGEIISP